MNIIAIDFATLKSGYAVFVDNILKDYGIMRSDSSNVHERIMQIRAQILQKILQYNIAQIVLEEVPMQKNNNLMVAHDLCVGQGMVLGLCCEKELGLKLYAPSSWRSIMGLYNGTQAGTKRDYQKQAAVDLANQLYGLDFQYYKNDTKKNKTDDDMAEAILLGLAFLKENEHG